MAMPVSLICAGIPAALYAEMQRSEMGISWRSRIVCSAVLPMPPVVPVTCGEMLYLRRAIVCGIPTSENNHDVF